MMTRTKPAEQRRAELLAAGQALFGAKGIAATSLEDIAQRAGVSKGLFYLYFHSKEDLVLALQEQFSHQVAARMRTAADSQADWTAKLDACAQASFECHRDLHDLHEVLFHHAQSLSASELIQPTPDRPASSRICSKPARPRAHSTWPTRKPRPCCATRACMPSTRVSAAATAQTTPGSSGPRGNCSGAPRAWPERASPTARAAQHDAPAKSPNGP